MVIRQIIVKLVIEHMMVIKHMMVMVIKRLVMGHMILIIMVNN